MNTKTWLAAVGCACTLAASGMPTQAELEKAQGLVTELMRSDVANFNERKMSAADVATAALKYAGEAQSEAARFLLLKGAFFYRVRAEDYDGAMDVISKIRNDINDVPDATLVNILSSAIRSIPRKRAGRLYDLQQRLQDRALYCVIDLSAGPNARKYPVSYLAAEPKGGWTDEYKTTKLVLRRIEPGKFMGIYGKRGSYEVTDKHEVTLTKPFYCGVFEVTKKQWELVTGDTHPSSSAEDDMRPVRYVSWNAIRGDSATYNWPSSVNVDPSTFMGKIRARTGLNFDLPTGAQWEYACRAGTTNDDNIEKHGPDPKRGYPMVVGSCRPNAWGLYDMHENVWEWCLDWRWDLNKWIDNLPSRVTDPVGPPSPGEFRLFRGGCWDNRVGCVPSFMWNGANPVWVKFAMGFRLFIHTDFPKERGIKPQAHGSLSGLKKPIAAKRIEEVKTDGFVDELAGAFSAARGSGDLYCVIDLSAGPNARKYPVSYLAAEPKGGWTDEYKTTKLVLRRIEPGKFMMGGKYEVTLTKPFYCGVFEVTQKQYELVTGANPSSTKGDMRSVGNVSWNAVRGNSATYNWPSSVNVDPSTFIGKIQARTSLNIDLPTEAQWEYACWAGTTNDDNIEKHKPDGKRGYPMVVGSYKPNAWGLYDMHENVWEWCLDWSNKTDHFSSGVTDPVGPSSAEFRVIRGGCWDNRVGGYASSSRNHANPVWVKYAVGFRLVVVPDLQRERGTTSPTLPGKAAGSK